MVIGIPDEVDGDLPMGICVMKPDENVTEEEIAEYVNGKRNKHLKRKNKLTFYTIFRPSF